MVQIPRLTEWRKARALTQVELAERAGVSARTVAGLEAGDSARLRTVRKLAEGLGVPVEELTEPPPSGREQFLSVQVQGLQNIEEISEFIGELVGSADEWKEISVEERESRLAHLRRVVGLLREASQNATAAAREALAIERGDPPEADTEDEPPAKRNPGQDRLAALLSTLEHTGTG
jgi:transcriptional regulator with XRE-family HTH domain